MKTLNMSDVKREFDEVHLKTQKEKRLITEVQKGLIDVELGKVTSAHSVFKNLHSRLNAY